MAKWEIEADAEIPVRSEIPVEKEDQARTETADQMAFLESKVIVGGRDNMAHRDRMEFQDKKVIKDDKDNEVLVDHQEMEVEVNQEWKVNQVKWVRTDDQVKEVELAILVRLDRTVRMVRLAVPVSVDDLAHLGNLDKGAMMAIVNPDLLVVKVVPDCPVSLQNRQPMENLGDLVKMVNLELLVLVGIPVFKVVEAPKVDKVHPAKRAMMANQVKLVNEAERDLTEIRET